MIQRKALENLRKWREDKYRKPLVLRDARQVGKPLCYANLPKNTAFLSN